MTITMAMRPDRVITGPKQVDIAWLNGVLMRSRAIAAGRVKAFQVTSSRSVNAGIARPHVDYEPGSTGPMPQSLLLKICRNQRWFTNNSEVLYYTRDYLNLADSPIPVCYDAQSSAAGYHILMEDLSATHRASAPPTLKNGIAAASALASLHEHAWGEERIGALGGLVPDQTKIEQYIVQIQPGLAPMLEAIEGDTNADWREELLDVFRNHPTRMVERSRHPDGFTVVHGDPNPGNILSSIEGTGRVDLLDRQPFTWSLTTWLGVSDIAYMMVHWWDTDVRRDLEIPVLREYHKHLVRSGIRNYDWTQLMYDYKLAAVQSIYVPTMRCVLKESREKMKWVWFPQLQKAMQAFLDLRCSDLWR